MAGALLAAAASDAPVNDRVTALDAFLGELRTDKALLLGDPTLWAGVLALASPGPSHPPEVAAAALRVAEEVVCRVQGLGDLRWTAMEDTARVVASCLARPGAGLIMIRQAIQFATSAYPPTFARVATTSEASPGLWALLEQIRNAVEALAGSSDDAGTLLAIARWVTAIVQTESWAMRDSRDAVVSGELPVGEACLELVGPNAVPVMLPPDALALRSTKLLEQLIGRLPLGDRAAVVSGTINSLLLLVRARPQFANMILLGIVDYWTAEEEAFSRTRSRWTAQQYRALERTVRNSLLGVFRYVTGLTLPHPAADLLLEKLNVRASELPQPYYLRLREIRAAERANLKRVEPPLESNNLPAKRPRTDLATLSARDTDGGLYLGQLPGLPTGPTSVVQNVLSLLQFDVSQIPVQTVIEMIIQVMRSCPDSAFQQAVIVGC